MKAVVDSSGWIEYFTRGSNSPRFRPVIRQDDGTLVPTIVLYEVQRWMLRSHGEAAALMTSMAMTRHGRPIPLTSDIALEAARISLVEGLATADSIVLATARTHGATLWTQDADFRKIAGVEYIPRS